MNRPLAQQSGDSANPSLRGFSVTFEPFPAKPPTPLAPVKPPESQVPPKHHKTKKGVDF